MLSDTSPASTSSHLETEIQRHPRRTSHKVLLFPLSSSLFTVVFSFLSQPGLNLLSSMSTDLGMGVVRYQDSSSSITYDGPWVAKTGVNYSGGSYHQAFGAEAHVDILFTATNITVKADSWYNHDRFYCYIVDLNQPWVWYNQSVGSPATSVVFNRTLCSVSGLPSGTHTLRMGMVAGDTSILDLDWYEVDTASDAGTNPIWSSHFSAVAPPVGYANTTSLPSTPVSSSTSSLISTSISSQSAVTSGGGAKKTSGGKKDAAALGAGIGAGLVAFCAIASFLLYWFWWRRRSSSSVSSPSRGEYGKGLNQQGWSSSPDLTSPTIAPSTISQDPGVWRRPSSGYGGYGNYAKSDVLTLSDGLSSTFPTYEKRLEDPNAFAPRLGSAEDRGISVADQSEKSVSPIGEL